MIKLIINANEIEDQLELNTLNEFLYQLNLIEQKDENVRQAISNTEEKIELMNVHLSGFGYFEMTEEEIQEHNEMQSQFNVTEE